MIKTLLAGAVLGIVGKKLYDEGKLDPFIAKVKATAEEQGLTGETGKGAAPAAEASTS